MIAQRRLLLNGSVARRAYGRAKCWTALELHESGTCAARRSVLALHGFWAMSNGNLSRLRDREVAEHQKSMIYLLGLAIVILVVIVAVALAVR